MTVGTPVVCSDAPALVEVAGEAATVVPREDPVSLAEAIRRLAEDPSERDRLRQLGLARSPMFEWDEVARQAWKLYGRVVEGPTVR
jgi:glycosyltransferase involved in cell wall biosynthesis